MGVGRGLTANDYYPFGMQMPGRKYTAAGAYRYGFNGQENSVEIAEGLTTAMFWEYDSRIGRRWNMDPVNKEYESPYSCFKNNPILLTDILGNDPEDPKDPDTYKVKNKETLSHISKKFGISVKDLQKMNKISDPTKLKSGQIIFVNPERNFINSPYADPASNNGIRGNYVVDKDMRHIAALLSPWFNNKISENTVYEGASGAMSMVMTSNPVRKLVEEGTSALLKDGKLTPGEVFTKSYSIGKLYGKNGLRILYEQYQQKMFKEQSDNKGLYGAEGILGSFDLSMRVKADGYTIVICVYDSKTIRSATDGIFGLSNRRFVGNSLPLQTIYERYMWNFILCAPELNQKK